MDKMMEVASDWKIYFDVLPFYQHDKCIEEILLEFIATDYQYSSGRHLRGAFFTLAKPYTKN